MLDMKIDKGLIEVNGKSESFKGTPYENLDFKIFFSRMTSVDQVKIITKQEDEDSDIMVGFIMVKEMFMNNTVKWENIKTNGRKLVCNEENKEMLFLYQNEFVTFAVLAYKKALEDEEKSKKK